MSENPQDRRKCFIGWLAEDLPDEEALDEFLADLVDDDSFAEVIVERPPSYTNQTVIWHSHREDEHSYKGSRALPVFIEWEPTDV
jgi:hypothetical protein